MMNTSSQFLFSIALIGTIATVVMDLWALFAKRALGLPMSDWALVGRWVRHCTRGQFVHDSIANAAPVPGELAIGWLVHYATGVAYALLTVVIGGTAWLQRPTPGLPLLVGLSMLVAPFFVMQPGMGYGVLASRTPKPGSVRLRSVLNHTVFGCGLYLGALATALLPFPR